MVVLLVADYIDVFVEIPLAMTHCSRAKVLRHIDRGAIGTEKDFFVEAVGGEVDVGCAGFVLLTDALFKSVNHILLAFEVGLRFVINLVESDAHQFVRNIKTVVNPRVHRLPERNRIGVALFPFLEHLVGFDDGRCFLLGVVLGHTLSHKFLDFSLVVLVELYIIIANQMVALDAGGFGSFAVSPFFPGEHRLADVYATVVDEVYLDDVVAASLQYARDRIAKEIVPQMSKVQRLVGIWRRKFEDDFFRFVCNGRNAEIRVGVDFQEHLANG